MSATTPIPSVVVLAAQKLILSTPQTHSCSALVALSALMSEQCYNKRLFRTLFSQYNIPMRVCPLFPWLPSWWDFSQPCTHSRFRPETQATERVSLYHVTALPDFLIFGTPSVMWRMNCHGLVFKSHSMKLPYFTNMSLFGDPSCSRGQNSRRKIQQEYPVVVHIDNIHESWH